MPIILAIEPDRRQAAHLTALVHRRVQAELILVPTTEDALDAIGNRVPDLVLVPALLSPQDDAALAAALRVIAAAARVQMLTIPVLGPPRPPAKSGGGVLSALRRDKSRSAETDGCDPAVFAEQIASYLERAEEERPAVMVQPEPDAPAAAMPAEVPEVPVSAADPVDVLAEWTDSEPTDDAGVSLALEEVARALFAGPGVPEQAEAIEADVDMPPPAAPQTASVAAATSAPMAESTSAPVPGPTSASTPEPTSVSAAQSEADADWKSVEELIAALQLMPLSAIQMTEEDEWIAPARTTEKTAEPDGVADEDDDDRVETMREIRSGADWRAPQKFPHGIASPDAAASAPKSEQEWVALVESLRHDVERIRTERTEQADKPAPRTPPARPSRPKKSKPVQDEWGLFDPEQCGFAALLAKLEEVIDEEQSQP
jgi:hypothetical protein